MKKTLITFLVVLSTVLSATTIASDEMKLDKIIELQRKAIFLLSDDDLRPELIERDTFIARNFYYQKRVLLDELERRICDSDDSGISAQQKRKNVDAFFYYTDSQQVRAADLLAFVDVIDALIYSNHQTPFLSEKQFAKARSLQKDLEKITQSYGKQLSEINKKLVTRGKHIEPWSSYINFLNTTYNREDIRKAFNKEKSDLNAPATRGAGSTKKKNPNLLWGFGMPEKTVVLTFDDGPHYRYTDTVLDILKKYNAKGYFFTVGKNFGNIGKDQLSLKKNAEKIKRALSEGHRVGNHTFSHPVLTKLSPEDRETEIEQTNTLLSMVTGQQNTVFRPPYGSRDDGLQALTEDKGMRSVMWNIDSKDWGDPMPDSIVERVMKNLETHKRGIILFHDIHKQTIAALPKILEKLNEQGYQYVNLDGQPFGQSDAKTVDMTAAEKTDKPISKSHFYKNSWAVVVGVNQYEAWPTLSYAVNDAKSVKQVLQDKFGFVEDHIFELYDEKATRDNIVELLGDTLANPKRVGPEDRVFIFYAGHGMTRRLPSGRDLGYIIPVDASFDKFHTRSISMTHLRDFSEMIPAKHVYFVMDSCYSGIALTRSGRTQVHNGYLEEITSRTARQILTAGGADQEVADGGPGGHSIFTWTLLQGLEGQADLDGNHIITASELGAYVAPSVSNNSSQTPSFGNLVGSEGGDFAFELAGLKAIEPEDTPPAGDKIAALEKKLADIERENRRLRELVEKKNTEKAQNPVDTMTPKERKALAVSEHGKGLEYYKKGDYVSALKHLKYAVKLDPVSPTIVNNYGFVLYKQGSVEESLPWLEKTIELEPKRTVVYLNIADALYDLNRKTESVPYYEHYLTLYPSSKKANEVKAKINSIKRK